VRVRAKCGGPSTPLRSGRDDECLRGGGRCGVDGVEVEGGGGFADGLVGFGVLGESDEGAVGAEDSGLFAGDLGDGVAEVVLVVEGNVSDDGEDGLDDVGGVEAAAETYFEDGDVYFLLCVVEEAEGGEDLEEAGGGAGGRRW